MSSRKQRKPKVFRAATEVRRRARTQIGMPPPVHRHQTDKRKSSKHKKREVEQETAWL